MLLHDHEKFEAGRDITDIVNWYKRKGTTQLREQTICHTPHLEDMINSQTFDYYTSGTRAVVDTSHQGCFRLNYVYVKSVPYQKYIYVSTFVKASMIECIENDYVKPFLLFIDGLFVPWEYISVIFTAEDYYLIVDTEDPIFKPRFRHMMQAHTIMLYDGIEYASGHPAVTDQTLFSFDAEGHYTTTNPTVCINNLGTMVAPVGYQNTHSQNYINAEKVMEDDDPLVKYRLQPRSTIVFKNGVLYPEANVSYVKTLLTLDEGIPSSEQTDIFDVRIFVNKNSHKSIDNLNLVDTNFIQQYVKDKNMGNVYPAFMNQLLTLFNVEHDKEKSFMENFIATVNTIMSYNSWLFNYIYEVNSNVDILSVRGKYINERVRSDKHFYIPRSHANDTQYCIMFVNGVLYKYLGLCKYEFNMWKVPVPDGEIGNNDKVEIFFFKRVNNSRLDYYRTEDDDEYQWYNSDYINKEMTIFSTRPKYPHFEYPHYDTLEHFKVDYSLDYDSEGRTRINIDPFYYNRKLKIAYKNQFRFKSFSVQDVDSGGEIKVNLGDEFMYCDDYDKYMVFVNGRRINKEHYRLVLPNRSTTPFYEFWIYFTNPIQLYDKIDVFYLPIIMKDIKVTNTMNPNTGIIDIPKNDITYPLSRDTYMLWVNGKKVFKEDIVDVDATHIRIAVDQASTYDVTLTKYIDDFDYLTPFFKNNTSLWSIMMNNMGNADAADLLGHPYMIPLRDVETHLYKNAMPMLSVMWELIRDQYVCNPYVDTTGAIVYDYFDNDKVADIGDRDSENNVLLQASDNERTDNLDTLYRQWP